MPEAHLDTMQPIAKALKESAEVQGESFSQAYARAGKAAGIYPALNFAPELCAQLTKSAHKCGKSSHNDTQLGELTIEKQGSYGTI
jgi:hypothetical protein